MADPADGVWNVTDVAEVDDFFLLDDIWDDFVFRPRWNLFDHHFCSEGRDSVGFDLEDVAKVMDLVVGAWSDLRFVEDLNVDMVFGLTRRSYN